MNAPRRKTAVRLNRRQRDYDKNVVGGLHGPGFNLPGFHRPGSNKK
jgi:hypothetical protein